MASPFSELQVIHRFVGNTRVQWRWTDRAWLNTVRPVSCSLEWARTPVGEWRKCDNAVVFDTGIAFDPDQRLFGQDNDLFYRIRASSGAGAYFSDPIQIGIQQKSPMWPQAKELLRLTQLNFDQNYNVVDGCLLKRRIWGPRCLNCTNPATGEVEVIHCPVCFQTGIVRGYYPPYPLKVLLSNKQKVFKYRDTPGGPYTTHGLTGTAMAHPVPIDERDVWMNYATGEMYRISDEQPVQESVKLGNFVIQQKFSLDILPASDVTYTFQTYCCGNGPGGSWSTGDGSSGDAGYTEEFDKICAPYEKPGPSCSTPELVVTGPACPDEDFGSPEEIKETLEPLEDIIWPE